MTVLAASADTWGIICPRFLQIYAVLAVVGLAGAGRLAAAARDELRVRKKEWRYDGVRPPRRRRRWRRPL